MSPKALNSTATQVTPTGTAHLVEERPPPGLAQGQYAWPAWWIGLAGGLSVALAIGYLLGRWQRR